MKKVLCLFAILFYSIAGNAQTLYVDNNSAVDVDVQGIAKMTSTCVTTSYCPMTDMMGIVAGTSSNQAYPTGCAATGNINLTVFVAGIVPPAPPIMVQIQWCGTQQSGSWGGGTYVLDLIGAGPDLLLDLN